MCTIMQQGLNRIKKKNKKKNIISSKYKSKRKSRVYENFVQMIVDY